MTTVEDELIKSELKNPGATPSNVARRLGLDYNRVKSVIAPRLVAVPSTGGAIPATAGNPKLVDYIVAIKLADHGWPRDKWDDLRAAQALYDGGTHEMYQGRQGNLIIQYCQPRRKPVERRRYFL